MAFIDDFHDEAGRTLAAERHMEAHNRQVAEDYKESWEVLEAGQLALKGSVELGRSMITDLWPPRSTWETPLPPSRDHQVEAVSPWVDHVDDEKGPLTLRLRGSYRQSPGHTGGGPAHTNTLKLETRGVDQRGRPLGYITRSTGSFVNYDVSVRRNQEWQRVKPTSEEAKKLYGLFRIVMAEI